VVSPVSVAVRLFTEELFALLGEVFKVRTPEDRSETVEYWNINSDVATPKGFTVPFKVAAVAVTVSASLVVTAGAGVVVKFKTELVEVPASFVALIL
jgi:hypothetical protein